MKIDELIERLHKVVTGRHTDMYVERKKAEARAEVLSPKSYAMRRARKL